MNGDQGVIIEPKEPTTSLLLKKSTSPDPDPDERAKTDFDAYADALLPVDALECHEITALEDVETGVLIDLYTLLSDVQRNGNDLRKETSDTLLD